MKSFLLHIVPLYHMLPMPYLSYQYKGSILPFVGDIAYIPIKNQKTVGLIIAVIEKELLEDSLKEIIALMSIPYQIKKYFSAVSRWYALPKRTVYRKIFPHRTNKIDFQEKELENEGLLEEQNKTPFSWENDTPVAMRICAYVQEKKYARPLAVIGPVGVGKTGTLTAIAAQLAREGERIFFMVASIKKAELLIAALQTHIASEKIIPLFSGIPVKEKKKIIALLHGKNRGGSIVVGIHLLPFFPLSSVTLCIIDDEHERNYREKKIPFLDSRDSMEERCRGENIPLVIATATPTPCTRYRIEQGEYEEIVFQKSVATKRKIWIPLEKGNTVDPQGMISRKLVSLMHEMVAERVTPLFMLFIDKKNYGTRLLCTACEMKRGKPSPLLCPTCHLALTMKEREMTLCSFCTTTAPIPAYCPVCCAGSHYFKKQGGGIRHVALWIKKLFQERYGENFSLFLYDEESQKKKSSLLRDADILEKKHPIILVGTRLLFELPYTADMFCFLAADMLAGYPLPEGREYYLQDLINHGERIAQKSMVVLQTREDISHRDLYELYQETVEEAIAQKRTFLFPPFSYFGGIICLYHEEKDVVMNLQQVFPTLSFLWGGRYQKKLIIYVKGKTREEWLLLGSWLREQKLEGKRRYLFIPYPHQSLFIQNG